MNARECVCAKFERLEGAAMQIYINDLLERVDTDEEAAETWYRCRCCAALWKQRAEVNPSKSSLVRLATEFNV